MKVKEENLIFIISQPRSGSTYFQNLLSNNNVTNTNSEFWPLLKFANLFRQDLFEAKFDHNLANTAFDDYLKKYPNFPYDSEKKAFLLKLYEPLIEGFDFVIDKTPRYYEIIDDIARLFPNSKIIILKRNPIDVAKSMIFTWDLLTIKDLGKYYRDLIYAPKKLHLFSMENVDNPNIYTLKYEDLIDNKLEIQKIYTWIGLPYNDEILNTEQNIKFKGIFGILFKTLTKVIWRLEKNLIIMN